MSHQELPGSGAALPSKGPFGRAALVLVLMIALICGAVTAGMLWNAGARADRELAPHRHQVRAVRRRQLPSGSRAPEWSASRSHRTVPEFGSVPPWSRRKGG